jgi:transposase
MSLKADANREIPEETVRVANAAFPKGNVYLQIRDEIGTIYQDEMFADLYPERGQPAASPWRLALITVMQFMENLSDRQAAEAVRARIDWKYVLGLELTDKGYDFSVLSEFRSRLLTGEAEQRLLDEILARLQEKKLLKTARQRTDSTHVLAAVRCLNRLETVGETLRAALNSVATVAPDWLRQQVSPDWFKRYSQRLDAYRLPKKKSEQQALATVIGQDGYTLLDAIKAEAAPADLHALPAIENLREMWKHQYQQTETGIQWRKEGDCPPAAERFNSPYDPEAKYAVKGSTRWCGYKAHLTETCPPDSVHIITHVETTAATVQDLEVTATIHHKLSKKGLLPKDHWVDCGYVDASLLLDSQQTYGINLIGPVQEDTSWQAREDQGYDLSHFTIDWAAQTVTCPQGKTATRWNPCKTAAGEAIFVRFKRQVCQPCSQRQLCTRAKQGFRTLKLRPQAKHEALQTVRRMQKTESWKHLYKTRAGVEGVISQGVRMFGLRRSRYIGLAKTHLQHIAIAAAANLVRTARWLQGIPHAETRRSPFAALAPA